MDNKKWWILLAMASSLAMVFIDQTAIPVALPQLQRDLTCDNTMLQWIVNSYILALAAFIIFGGKIGDIIGQKKSFIIGTFIFVTASISCALNSTALLIILNRFLQGLGGALMIPAAGILVINAFDPHERGKAMGIYMGISSLFLSAGPLISGIITQYIGWRWIFWLNIPFALASITIAFLIIPNAIVKKSYLRELDWLGFAYLTCCLFTFVFALMEGNIMGWGSSVITSTFFISFLTFFLFIKTEKKHVNSLVDLALFKNKIFLRCCCLLIIVQGSLICMVFWAFFLENILNLPASKSGLLLLPVFIPITLLSPIAGKLHDQYGPRLPISVGTLLMAISMLWLGVFAYDQNYLLLIPSFLAFGSGVTLVISSTITSIITSVEPHKRGQVSGLSSAARYLGGAISFAIIGSLITNLNHINLSEFLSRSKLFNHLQTNQIDGLLTGSENAKQSIMSLNSSNLSLLIQGAKHAYTFSFSCAMLVISLICVVGFYIAIKLPHNKSIAPIKDESTLSLKKEQNA